MIDTNWSPANVDDAESRVSTTVLRPAETETHWRSLKRGDFLYRKGDLRVAFFKLHRGAIALFLHRPSRPNEVIEIAAPGEWVGLGCQERYIECAQVLVDSVVMHVARDDFAQLASIDLTLREPLVVLCHDFRSRDGRAVAWAQQGQRDSILTRPAMRRRRRVGIELTTCRSGRSGGASGSITPGNGRLRDEISGSMS